MSVIKGFYFYVRREEIIFTQQILPRFSAKPNVSAGIFVPSYVACWSRELLTSTDAKLPWSFWQCVFPEDCHKWCLNQTLTSWRHYWWFFASPVSEWMSTFSIYVDSNSPQVTRSPVTTQAQSMLEDSLSVGTNHKSFILHLRLVQEWKGKPLSTKAGGTHTWATMERGQWLHIIQVIQSKGDSLVAVQMPHRLGTRGSGKMNRSRSEFWLWN